MTETDQKVSAPAADTVPAPGLMSLFVSWQFIRFVLVGGVAAVLHWLARYLLNPLTGYVAALVLAYMIGIAVGYILNALFVFSDAKTRRRKQIAYFVAFNLLMAPVVIGVAYILSEYVFARFTWMAHPREIAHAIGVASPIFINFLLHKFFTFKGG